jgi:hypothetical protein
LIPFPVTISAGDDCWRRLRDWMARFRRLSIRYEQLADIHLAFLDRACALLCLARRTPRRLPAT